MRDARLVWLLLSSLGGAACSKGLVPGTTYDQPLLSFTGVISPRGGLLQANPHHPIVGLLWTDPLQHTPDVPMPGSWLRSTVSPSRSDTVDDTFTVDIFRPPPPEALVELTAPTREISQLAVAEIVLVDDQDGDGTFRLSTPDDAGNPHATIAPNDLYLAASANVLTYVARPFPPPVSSPLTLPGQIGYGLVAYNCQGQVPGGLYPASPQAINLVMQPSANLPDVRICMASHGP